MSDNSEIIQEISGSLKEEEKKKKEKLENINYVDLDELEFENTSAELQKNTIESIFGKISTYEVVCIQSGYSVTLSSLTYKDILTITNASVSSYETRKNLFETIHKKIEKMSFCGKNKPKFEDWMKMTSYGDLETLLYGIYCATFQEKSTVSFDCPYCDEEVVATIDNSSLVQVEGNKNELSKEINEISLHSDSIEKVSEFSLVSTDENNKKRNIKNIILPSSKFIFSLKLPTMHDVLNILKTVDETVLGKLSADVFNMLLVIPFISVKKENGKYFSIGHKNDILHMIEELSVDDISVLKTAVYNLLEQKHIYYQINKQTCPNCKKDIFNIPLNIEDLLFFQISEKQLI